MSKKTNRVHVWLSLDRVRGQAVDFEIATQAILALTCLWRKDLNLVITLILLAVITMMFLINIEFQKDII
ncbi:MAG: hypothetical protein WBJ81_00375 [Rickettsiales bacterium]